MNLFSVHSQTHGIYEHFVLAEVEVIVAYDAHLQMRILVTRALFVKISNLAGMFSVIDSYLLQADQSIIALQRKGHAGHDLHRYR